MTEDVQAVKAMRKHELVEIASQLEVRPSQENHISLSTNKHQTPLNSSLKRKRSDDEGEDEGTSVMRVAVDRDGIGSRETVAQSTTKSLVSIAVPSVVQTTRRSTKRLRRMASTVMHTATAMTLGAVATWSALAFS
jgi:CCR4-NOT transcriptional regulation complex NOT5 subunit